MCAARVSWRDELDEILKKNACRRLNGRVADNHTEKHTREVAFNFMNTCHRLGLNVQRLENVKRKHLEAVFQHWYHEKKLKPKTLQDYASRLRILFSYVGKANFVEDHKNYLPGVDPETLVVRAAAQKSKSLSQNDVRCPDRDVRWPLRRSAHR